MAERVSVEQLDDQCRWVAPIENVEEADPAFRECERRVTKSLDEAWADLGRRALDRCVQQGQECCLDRRPLHTTLVYWPGSDEERPKTPYERHLGRCNEECTSRLGHPPRPNGSCEPTPPPRVPFTVPKDFARTAAERAVVARCTTDPGALADCDTLRGAPVRDFCRVDCKAAIGEAVFERAVDECVRRATGRIDEARCVFEPPAGALQTVQGCTAKCRARLDAKP